ncbi:MAG: hypothetical protein ACK559_09580 [bacterium]
MFERDDNGWHFRTRGEAPTTVEQPVADRLTRRLPGIGHVGLGLQVAQGPGDDLAQQLPRAAEFVAQRLVVVGDQVAGQPRVLGQVPLPEDPVVAMATR